MEMLCSRCTVVPRLSEPMYSGLCREWSMPMAAHARLVVDSFFSRVLSLVGSLGPPPCLGPLSLQPPGMPSYWVVVLVVHPLLSMCCPPGGDSHLSSPCLLRCHPGYATVVSLRGFLSCRFPFPGPPLPRVPPCNFACHCSLSTYVSSLRGPPCQSM